ncbi:Inositol hexakisphosphate kinase 2 [Gryllus bimaculatus]|nr:Inositol hexakisphosphate kinase 2 [Gryllus bimaculatus]
MRVYQNGPGLLRRDKYWGRSLDETGFKGALRRFFHSGRHLRVAVVRRVIAKLEELRRAIERQTSYRFYSCSLLVVYEGSPDSNQGCTSHCENLNSCNLDGDSSLSQESHQRGFAEAAARGSSTTSSFVPISEETVFPDPSPSEMGSEGTSGQTRAWLTNSLSGPDTSSDLDLSLESASSGGSSSNKRSRLSPAEGWTDFLATSVSSDFELSASSCSECTPMKRIRQLSHCSDSNIDEEEEEDDDDDFSTALKSCTQRFEDCNVPPRVDVRMIDFAHTTCHGDPGPSTLHLGPDGGFLTGLDSLRRLLREILAEG